MSLVIIDSLKKSYDLDACVARNVLNRNIERGRPTVMSDGSFSNFLSNN